MENTNWLKQTRDTPLFPDLLWSRPENKRHAGKLLIVGGNKHGFAAPAAAYSAAEKAGVGSGRVLLPESLRRTVGSLLEADFAPSNISGSFAKSSLAIFLEHAAWADGVLLSGNLGRNSETAVVLDSFVQKYQAILVVADDALDYFINAGSQILARPDTVLVINLGKLQKLAKNNGLVLRHQDSLAELVRKLNDWSQVSKASFITRHENQLVVATAGRVSTTPWNEDSKWQIELAAYAIVWIVQNPSKPFEALTAASYNFIAEFQKPKGL